MTIEIKEIPVETYNNIDKIERYYQSLRRAYKIIRDELQNGINTEIILYKVRPAQFTLSGEESCVNFTIDSMNFWSFK
jgi:hypothetical protein